MYVYLSTVKFYPISDMARKTKEDAEVTRENILEAAAVVFADKGVAGASLDEIAKMAGVTRGAVYWHFKNKVDIFQALHDQLHIPFMDMILQDLEKDCPNPLEQLEQLCVKLLLDIISNEQKQRILKIFFLKCDFSGEMEPILECKNKKKAESYELFARYFKDAQLKGHLPQHADSYVLTVSLFCYLTGIVHEYVRCPGLIDLHKHAPMMIRLFFVGFAGV